MLAHEPRIYLVIQRNDADGFVFEMDFAVDAGFSGWIDHLVFGYLDPGIVVFLVTGKSDP